MHPASSHTEVERIFGHLVPEWHYVSNADIERITGWYSSERRQAFRLSNAAVPTARIRDGRGRSQGAAELIALGLWLDRFLFHGLDLARAQALADAARPL